MAKVRSYIIKSTDQLGNAYQKTFTNANPAATDAQIDTFARAVNNLSTNTYVDTIKVETESVNEALAEAENEG